MIQYKTGNLFNDDSEAIVNTVNCVGVMGKGLALQFKKKYPDNFKAYTVACKHGYVQPCKMFVFKTNVIFGPKYIINFPTKRHWSNKSRIEDIECGLKDLVDVINKNNISSIAIPPLGSGLGGLEWSKVKEAINKTLVDTNVIVYEPIGG